MEFRLSEQFDFRDGDGSGKYDFRTLRRETQIPRFGARFSSPSEQRSWVTETEIKLIFHSTFRLP